MIETAQIQDGPAIQQITALTGVFTPEEVACVTELWQAYLGDGAQTSGYHFIVYRPEQTPWGYACYGPRALAQGVYDLFWIAVDPRQQGRGIGRALLRQVEAAVLAEGGRLVVAETSGQEQYAPTRQFYLRAGYQPEATLRNFYRPGDDLVIFTRHLQGETG